LPDSKEKQTLTGLLIGHYYIHKEKAKANKKRGGDILNSGKE